MACSTSVGSNLRKLSSSKLSKSLFLIVLNFFPLQEERDRHVSMTKERVARLRYEKTMTMKEKGSHQARKFDEMLSDGETQGMTEDEKMAAAAKKVEDSLRIEEKKERKRKTPVSSTVDLDVLTQSNFGPGQTNASLYSNSFSECFEA